MSEQDSEIGFSLIPYESRELAVQQSVESRILGEMVETSLVLARDSAVAPVDLDALVCEGKKLFRSNGKGMTEQNVKAFKLFLCAAKAGHHEAQCYLGCCYEYGDGVSQDYVESAKWYRKAAEQGNVWGQLNQGGCYNLGRGVPRDYVESAKWYRKAAEQGNAWAQHALGGSYYLGQGVPHDMAQAYKWHHLSANQGHEQAKERVAALSALMAPSDIEAAESASTSQKQADVRLQPRQNPMDILEAMDKICEKSGTTQEVGSAYYRKFSELENDSMSKLLCQIILDRADELNEIIFGKQSNSNDLVGRVQTWLLLIGFGRCRFDSNGELGFCKPVGPEPTIDERAAIERRLESARDLVAPAMMRVIKKHREQMGDSVK